MSPTDLCSWGHSSCSGVRVEGPPLPPTDFTSRDFARIKAHSEGRHAVRSGSRRVEITSSFHLTLESVPAFRLFSRRTTYAFGKIGPSNGSKHRHVAALRASWTLGPAPAYGRKLPGVSTNISAEGGVDSTRVNHWFFPPGIEDHSGGTR